MLEIMRHTRLWSKSETTDPQKILLWLVAGGLFIGFLLWSSLNQGLNWDEPWLVSQARIFAHHQPTEAFKPLAGVIAWPVVGMDRPWVALRMLFVGWQILLALAVWRLLPESWGPLWRGIGVVLLWLEPTFRERVLEARTEVPAILAIGIAVLIWHKRLGGWPRWAAGIFMAVALALAPKSALWILPWLGFALHGVYWKEGGGTRMDLLFCLVIILFGGFALWAGGALWTHRSLGELIQGSVIQNNQALSVGGLLPVHSRRYLLQVLWRGWPFYALVVVGVCSGAYRQLDLTYRHWIWCGGLPWLLVPFYSGAFPYHFVGLIPSLVPLALLGLRWLKGRFGIKVVVGVFAVLVGMAIFSALPVITGPTLGEQIAIVKYVEAALPENAGYLDGVGLLRTPQSAPFVTGNTIHSPEIGQILERWKRERMALILLDGRSEQLFEGDRLYWLQKHFVIVHPNVLVLGTSVASDSRMDYIWDLPWGAELIFRGTPSWTWSIGGRNVRDGDRLWLSSGGVHLQGHGPGRGLVILQIPMPNQIPEPLPQFFLPFQRL